MRFGNRILKLSGVSLSDSPSPPPCPSSDRSGRESPGSAAGPELPVRFSQCSIASNRDSHDPWSGRSDDSGGSFNGGALGDAAAYTTLTTPTFRQRADKDRSFTASAPPGLRPPSKRQTPGGDDGAEKGIDWAKLSKIESRPAHWLAASSHTCRPYPMPIPSSSCGAKGCPLAAPGLQLCTAREEPRSLPYGAMFLAANLWTPRRESSAVSESAPLMRPPVCAKPCPQPAPTLNMCPACVPLASACACAWPPRSPGNEEGNAPTVSAPGPGPSTSSEPTQPGFSPTPYKAEVTASALPREEGKPSSGRQRRRQRSRSRRVRRHLQAAARRGAARQHAAAT